VPSILELIEPLAEAGQLVRRPKEMLEEHVDRFTVVERDGMIVACVAVYPFPQKKTAEIACVAVHPSYRSAGRAAVLVEYAERRAREQGMQSVFVLTTQAEHFFREQGYEPSSEKKLPSGKKVDPGRKSKVFVKRF